MKYIVFTNRKDGQMLSIIFDESIVHLHIAQGLNRTHVAISAGFCYKTQKGNYYCEGGSESLKLESNQVRDTMLVNMMYRDDLSQIDMMNLQLLNQLKP